MKYFVVCILMVSFVPIFAELGPIHFHGGFDPVRSHLTGDYYYSLGDAIKFNGWANAWQDGGSGMIIIPYPTFDIKITDPDGHVAIQQNMTGNKDGNAEFLFPIKDDFKTGQYLMTVQISKDGYGTYEYGPIGFDVIKNVKDEIKSQDHTVKIWPEKTKVRFATTEKIFVSVCPSPLQVHTEEFIDPETGFRVYDSYFLVNYYITKPDGTKNIQTDSSTDSYRCNESLENKIYADTPGKWTISASAKWVKDGILHYAKSNAIDITVEDPVFSSTQVERILDKWYVPLDWSPDGKYILVKNATEYYMKNNVQLELVNAQDHSMTKLTIPINYDNDNYVETAKFSSDGNEIFFVTTNYLHRYDIANKTVQDIEIKNIEGFSVDSLGNVFYSAHKPQSTDERYFEVWKTDLVNTVKVASGPDFILFDVNNDGTKLLYKKSLEGGYGWQNSVLAVYDIEGKRETTIPKITDADCGSTPQWAPNNDLIIYHISDCGKGWPGGMIKITDMDGNENMLIQPSNNNPANFIVSPDGKYLVYSQSYSDENTKSGLYQMTLTRAVPEFKTMEMMVLVASVVPVIIFSKMRKTNFAREKENEN